jgi:hypothetical protein
MAKILIHVWHSVTGEILAIGRPMGWSKCIPVCSDGQAVLETEIEEDQIEKLHQTHLVDVGRRALIVTGEHTGG